MPKKTRLLSATLAAITVLLAPSLLAQAAAKKPNILVIWGDDIGQFNISAYNLSLIHI